jgi:hypothetical protein
MFSFWALKNPMFLLSGSVWLATCKWSFWGVRGTFVNERSKLTKLGVADAEPRTNTF